MPYRISILKYLKIIALVFTLIVAPMRPSEAEGAQGSGVFINADGYFITAAHVVDGEKAFKIRYDGKLYIACLIYADYFKDVAILKVSIGHPVPFYDVAYNVQMGEIIAAYGFPGAPMIRTFGRVKIIKNDSGRSEGTAFVCHGMSGGPVINVNHQIIGLVDALYYDRIDPLCSTQGIYVSLATIMQILDENHIQYSHIHDLHNEKIDAIIVVFAED